jgi:hypothetical protein
MTYVHELQQAAQPACSLAHLTSEQKKRRHVAGGADGRQAATQGAVSHAVHGDGLRTHKLYHVLASERCNGERTTQRETLRDDRLAVPSASRCLRPPAWPAALLLAVSACRRRHTCGGLATPTDEKGCLAEFSAD